MYSYTNGKDIVTVLYFRDSEESASKCRKISDAVSEKKSAKITDYFRIISRPREVAIGSGELQKDNAERPKVPGQEESNGSRDGVRSSI